MTYPKSFLFLFLSILPLTASGQKRNTPFSSSKNYLSYRFGVGYPFFKDGAVQPQYASGYQLYEFSNEGVNYACHGGFGIGHYFGKSFSLGLSPFLIYSKFASTNYHSEYISSPTQTVLVEQIGTFHYNHLSVLAPLDVNFRITKEFDFTFGVFVLKPFYDFEFDDYIEIDHRYNPPKTYTNTESNKNRNSNYRSGVHGQFSILLNERDWQKTRIKLEYYHSLTSANFQVYERWILVAFEKVFYQ